MLKGNRRAIVLIAGVVAMVAAPFAIAAGEGEPTRGGARNPSNDQRQHYTQETQIIANTATYGTRQSNVSANGGGAIYGCRSGAGGTPQQQRPCLRATNLNQGLAFELESRGLLGGTIVVGNGGDNTKPFTTNATGVATGLNADRVDGRNAEEFVLKTEAEGQFARAGDLLFAAVTAAGTVSASRGGETTATYDAANNRHVVTFARNVSACSFTATPNVVDADPVALGAASTGERTVAVRHAGATPVGFHLQVVC
jgi:hypothetical protein